jgi:DNA-binding transcriptional ArsR family regulator
MTVAVPDPFADLDRFRLPPTTPPALIPIGSQFPSKPTPAPKRMIGEFLKGPIPLLWLTVAATLAGKGPLAVGLAAWFESGRRKSKEVRLTTAILKRFGVNRKTKYRALKSLEGAGLIRVRREPRKNPVVTILDLSNKAEPSGADRISPKVADGKVNDLGSCWVQ